MNVIDKIQILLAEEPTDELIGIFRAYLKYDVIQNPGYLYVNKAFRELTYRKSL